ncbi:hypothetical protein SNEBB_010168 [Seison nebaliae]|nr:hypothetical protein SNEBB_010168 [Seison nebaliae]
MQYDHSNRSNIVGRKMKRKCSFDFDRGRYPKKLENIPSKALMQTIFLQCFTFKLFLLQINLHLYQKYLINEKGNKNKETINVLNLENPCYPSWYHQEIDWELLRTSQLYPNRSNDCLIRMIHSTKQEEFHLVANSLRIKGNYNKIKCTNLVENIFKEYFRNNAKNLQKFRYLAMNIHFNEIFILFDNELENFVFSLFSVEDKSSLIRNYREIYNWKHIDLFRRLFVTEEHNWIENDGDVTVGKICQLSTIQSKEYADLCFLAHFIQMYRSLWNGEINYSLFTNFHPLSFANNGETSSYITNRNGQAKFCYISATKMKVLI